MSQHSSASKENSVTATHPMHLTLFINPTGHHQAAWRHPRSTPDAGVNFAHYVELAQAAERACFDAIFFADNQVVRQGPPEVVARVAQYVANFEPLTLMSALSARTERIGFISTASTSYNFPFHVARKFASIDHISGGRAGWNVVTSGMPGENFNFGRDAHYPHDELYERAAEFVEICQGLWDSWDDDAFPRDPETGIFSEIDRMHTLDHEGRFFRVRGPLNVARSPQGHPLLVQAGQSPEGTQFAARYADMIFVTPQSLQEGQERYRMIKELAEAAGRDPDHVKVMPGLAVITGQTEADAEADFQLLQSLLHPDVALKMLATKINMSTGRKGEPDLSGYPLDEPLPLGAGEVSFGPWAERGQREGLTLIELARAASESLVGLSLRGSGEHVADVMEEWVRGGAADGFNIQPAFLPGGLDDFIAYVVPHLQSRGLLRRSYEGRTLRDHFGLPRMPVMARPVAT